MDVDSVDVTHHIRAQQQPISNTPVDLLENPWMEIIPTVNHLDNVVHSQPNAQPIYNTPEASPINASSSSALSAQDITYTKKTDTLLTVDDSIHSPPKDKIATKTHRLTTLEFQSATFPAPSLLKNLISCKDGSVV